MISYYHSKNPGIFIYLALIIISTLYFCFIPLQSWSLGFLAMGWSVYTFMRTLSLFEVTINPAPLAGLQNSSRTTLLLPATLPNDLMKRMNGKDHLSRANYSLQALSARSSAWLALAAIYAICELYLALHGISYQNAIPLEQKTAILFIIGASFWAGQTYAGSDFLIHILFWLFAAIITLCITTGQIDFSLTFPDLDILSTSHMIALPLFAYSLVMLFPSLFRSKTYAFNGIAGIAVLLFMGYSIIMLPTNSAQIAILVTGWSLFSLYWIRSSQILRKNYTLRV